MDDFNKNVFVNCPFDEDYREILLAIVFTLKSMDLHPRLSLERVDSAETRIDKIVGLIRESKYGIHDISRMVAKNHNETFRMNMPFELGIDYGCQKLNGEPWSSKQILILDTERFRFQKAISDLSGCDIKSHNDDGFIATKVVRNWFNALLSIRIPSGNNIWQKYNDFQAYLYDELIENDGHTDVEEVEIIEIIQHMNFWFEAKAS
ncbi:hypothetical protein [Pseudoalteromonas sp. T1lg122]|uniref:hypothetical protein n=1 Tax=Pseudoalteromonas sp. T1lg122 TaxID=2077094 RepID=UPI000CF69C79|nr:hypothetical protein [Pseudoalteromonas sp. T1lg122]